jgi:hypothetical protein
MSKEKQPDQQITRVETKEVRTGDDFVKGQRGTYMGPRQPVAPTPDNTINPTPTESPATPAAPPVTDQGGSGGDK